MRHVITLLLCLGTTWADHDCYTPLAECQTKLTNCVLNNVMSGAIDLEKEIGTPALLLNRLSIVLAMTAIAILCDPVPGPNLTFRRRVFQTIMAMGIGAMLGSMCFIVMGI